MKAVLWSLLIPALLLAPVFGQTAKAPAPSAGIGAGSDAGASDSRMVGDTQPAPLMEQSHDDALQFPVMRTLGGMGLVLCLMGGVYFGAKKFAPRFFPKAISERNLKILETLSMGDKRSIALIEIGNNRFLIGNTPNQINLLATLAEPLSLVSEPDATLSDARETGKRESRPAFKNLFEIEKKRPTQYTGNSLPDDIRTKMRQLREALER